MAGNRLGRYEIIKTLAKGALTDLLVGRADGMEGFQRYVAIKRLRPEFARDAKVFESFVNEARLAAVLHHHNIVQVHDIGEEHGQPYFAMEYVHGVDLRTLLGKLAKLNQQLPLQHVVSVVASAAAALHHAHEQKGPDGKPLGIVHRDVTPANILVGYDGNVKVVDFGIAKAAIKRISTDAGVLKGQAPYMSPEVCAGQTVDRRSDVFALGVVLYELATVRRLFKGATEFLTMSAVINAAIPKPSQYRRDIPQQLEAIMLKALSRNPDERYQTAGEMSLALDQVATTVGVGASTTALANYMRLQFGEQKEPWLQQNVWVDGETTEVTEVDFDGGASGLAPPPSEAVNKTAIPRTIAASKSSPIAAARTHALTPSPDESGATRRAKSPTRPEPRAKSPTTPDRPPSPGVPAPSGRPALPGPRTKGPTNPPAVVAAPSQASDSAPTLVPSKVPATRTPTPPSLPAPPTILPRRMQRAISETTPDGRTPDARTQNLRSRLPPIPGGSFEDLEHAPTDVAPALDAAAFDGATDVDGYEPTEIQAVPKPVPAARDMTEIVTPLSVYAQTTLPQRARRPFRWQPIAIAIGALVVLGAVAAAVVMWPSDDATSVAAPEETAQVVPNEAEEAKPEETKPEETKPEEMKPEEKKEAAVPEKSAMQMTQADYERERAAAASEDAGVAAAAVDAALAAVKQEGPKEEVKPEPEPVAKKPVVKRTTTKAPAKRTVSKAQAKVATKPAKKATAKKPAKKPKWNPDDLFLDGK